MGLIRQASARNQDSWLQTQLLRLVKSEIPFNDNKLNKQND